MTCKIDKRYHQLKGTMFLVMFAVSIMTTVGLNNLAFGQSSNTSVPDQTYVGARDLNEIPFGTHQYIVLTVDNPNDPQIQQAISNLRSLVPNIGIQDLGDGNTPTIVIGAHNVNGDLKVEAFNDADKKATEEHKLFDPDRSETHPLVYDWSTQLEPVTLPLGLSKDEFTVRVLELAYNYASNTQTNPVPYPPWYKNIFGQEFNSNSWAQSIIEFASGKVIENFKGFDTAHGKKLPIKLFEAPKPKLCPPPLSKPPPCIPPPPPPSSSAPPSSPPAPSPLAFVLDPYDKIEHTTVWPDQCKLWNTENSPNKDKLWIFNPYHYEDVCMNIKMTGGYVLFIDFNDNDVIDGCVELLCNFYKGDQRLTTYQILDNEITNANDDEWFSTVDPLFSKAKAWRPSENTTHTMDELNITGFHIRDYWVVQDDYKLVGQYADCVYVQDNAYLEAIEDGWECTQLAMHHMRIVAFDGHGVALNNGSFVPSYDFVFGYWNPAQVANTEIVDSTAE